MLGDISKAENIYIACGYTDMRKAIDGLAAIVKENFAMDPMANNLFLFCGKRRDRIKALYWEGDGFVLLYKRLETGRFQWPRSEKEVRLLSTQEFRWLMEGLCVNQPKALKPVGKKSVL
jgi:transposase